MLPIPTSRVVFNPVAFFLPLGVVEPVQIAHEISGDPAGALKPHALPDCASGRQLMVYSH